MFLIFIFYLIHMLKDTKNNKYVSIINTINNIHNFQYNQFISLINIVQYDFNTKNINNPSYIFYISLFHPTHEKTHINYKELYNHTK